MRAAKVKREVPTFVHSFSEKEEGRTTNKRVIYIAQKHLNAGEEVWLVTAAPEDMAILIAKNLGFTGALGSKAEVRDGKYTGQMLGKLLHGKEKAVAIAELATEKGFSLSDCYAYSDSHNDFPLLEAVGPIILIINRARRKS